ncbi:MAG TPA: hypothetical protein VEA79_08650 [Phenylobacterium sp.]|nr:hypothetical protein [Phenylobacterium sp.]
MAFDDDRPSEREIRHRRKITGIHVASLLIGLAVGVLTVVAQRRDFPPWVMPAVTAAVFAAGMGLTLYWWRQIDEAARAAHLEAFFWGGMSGLMAALVAATIVLSYRETIGLDGRSAAVWFTNGVFATFLATTAGYALAWLAWWLRRR